MSQRLSAVMPWLGLYEHANGPWYLVLMTVSDSTNARTGENVVLYFSLRKLTFHVREEIEFLQRHENGKPRFRRHWAFDLLMFAVIVVFWSHLIWSVRP